MPDAISNTSLLLYLYRIGAINWLPGLFGEVWTPDAVKSELLAGRDRGYNVPDPADYAWLKTVNCQCQTRLVDTSRWGFI